MKLSPILFAYCCIFLLACGPSAAQVPDSAFSALKKWDRNKDGLLEKSEIPPARVKQGLRNGEEPGPAAQQTSTAQAIAGCQQDAGGKAQNDDREEGTEAGEIECCRRSGPGPTEAGKRGQKRLYTRTSGFAQPQASSNARPKAFGSNSPSKSVRSGNSQSGAAPEGEQTREQKRIRFLPRA